MFNCSHVNIGRGYTPRPLYYCLFTPHICGVVLRTHSVCGETRIQRNASREFATTSPPFYNEPHQSHVLLVMAFTQHDLRILVTAPFCCERKARVAGAQSFALWQIMRRDHSSRTLDIMLN